MRGSRNTYLAVFVGLCAALIGLCILFSFWPPTNHVFLVALGGLAAVLVVLLVLVANRLHLRTGDEIPLVSVV